MIKKLFISFIFIIALLFSFSIFAFADPIGGAGLLSGGLSSIGIDLLTGGSATVATLAPWLNNNYSLIGDLTGVANGYIKIGDSSIFIDGKEFESVFLDPNMAQSLHTQILDFKTIFGIVSNSSGIIATGVGTVNGIDLYSQNNEYVTQTFSFSDDGIYQVGTLTYNFIRNPSTAPFSNFSVNNSNPSTIINLGSVYSYPVNSYLRALGTNPTSQVYLYYQKPNSAWSYSGIASTIVYDPFDFSYVSGNIDVDPLPSDYGFQVFVPVDDLEDAGFTPGTIILDGSTGTDEIIQLIQLLDEIFENEEILNPEFTDVVDPPSPTPTPIPIPTDALGSVPYPDFIDTFGQSIYDRLDNIEDTVDTVGQSINDELEYQSSIFDTIGLAIDSIEDAVTNVVDGIQVKVGEIADTLVDIKDGILEAIEEGPIKLIDSGIDVLRSIFGPILQTIRSHVGIWHYVVSWVQSISTPFTWILGIANGTSYYMVLPLYALIAGTLVIAIYKRFGR